MATRPSEDGAFQVAIVGSGPSGFYAAEALLRRVPDVQVDMFDRLPTPFGLVRGGVAPDHPKIKQVTAVYDKIAQSPRFRFVGNVMLGRDIASEELVASYHAVIIACGASTDRRLGIPGEDLAGSHTATEFVGWYNGHPDYRNSVFDLSAETAVVIGHGNVAADVIRVLARPIDEFRRTDISEHAIKALARSRIKNIHVIGRRGPAQAKFTSPELKELLGIPDCAAFVNSDDLQLNSASSAEIAEPHGDESKKNMALFLSRAGICNNDQSRGIQFRFHEAPVEINGGDRVTSITLAKCRLEGPPFAQVAVPTTARVELTCGLVFRSIGYVGVPIPGLNFDEKRGVIPNTKGRYISSNAPHAGVYVTGWIKRGATGIIGTNRADSVETVDTILADLPALNVGRKPGISAIDTLLRTRGIQVVDYAGWQAIDDTERKSGALKGKPREKLTFIAEMLEFATHPGQQNLSAAE